MKPYMMLVIFCLSCFMADAALFSEKKMRKLRRKMKIESVKDDTIREKNGTSERLIIFTSQADELSFDFEMRIVAELTDAEGNCYLLEASKSQGKLNSEYTGDDGWKFQIAHGTDKKLSLSAYVIQYGFMANKTFIPIVEETSDVKSVKALKKRTSGKWAQKAVFLHQYSYYSFGTTGGEDSSNAGEDEGEGEGESGGGEGDGDGDGEGDGDGDGEGDGGGDAGGDAGGGDDFGGDDGGGDIVGSDISGRGEVIQSDWK